MSGKNSAKLVGVLLLTLLFSTVTSWAQPLPPPYPFYKLNTWSFNDTNWLSGTGFPPVSFTNLNNPPGFDGNALQVDTNVPAWLQYNLFESNGYTNLTLSEGSVEFWVLPDWNSGTGPGDWGRLVDVGAFGTNSQASWWSLYFDPGGTNIWFSSVSGGVFTNYLSFPITWDTNTWHYVALTYRKAGSKLYLDGQLATNGMGVSYRPSDEVVSNGFFIGSDHTGWAQSRVLIDDLATYNYPLNIEDVTNDYAAGMQLINGGGTVPFSGGGGFANGDGSGSGNSIVGPGTNLWIGWVGISNGIASFWVTNTQSDVLYELQGSSNLVQTSNWASLGFFNGSEISNAIALTLSASKQGNLFMRVRSWVDSTGDEIPDWWWLQYFGQITNVDAYASDPSGDGYSDLQKYQMGLVPTSYFNPNGMAGFFGGLDVNGTNAILNWNPAPGPVINYSIQRGIQGTNGNYEYSQIALVSSNATFYADNGAITNDNALDNLYLLTAIYADGGTSGTNSWEVVDYYGPAGPPNGPPLPNNIYAYVAASSTDVLVSWTPPTGGSPTNYLVFQGVYDLTSGDYDYSQIASLATNTTIFDMPGAIQTSNDWNDVYEILAVYPGGSVSQPATVSISTTPPPPTDVTAIVDATGTNIVVTWEPPQGVTVNNYVVARGTYDSETGTYDYATIATVGGSVQSFVDSGAITANGSYNYSYELTAKVVGGSSSGESVTYYASPPTPVLTENLRITASLARNGTGRWQVMFSGIPTNAQSIQLTWTGNGSTIQQAITESNIVNGVYSISDSDVVNLLGDSLTVQPFDANGNPGQICQAGTISSDAPYFVDGRQHMKQNLIFLIRAASVYTPFGGTLVLPGAGVPPSTDFGRFNQSATNFEEFSFLCSGMVLDDLWPFNANAFLANNIADISRTNLYESPFGTNDFIFLPDFAADIPATQLIVNTSPLWILQPAFGSDANRYPTFADLWGITLMDNDQTASLESGIQNLYGLPYQDGCEIDGGTYYDLGTGLPFPLPPNYQILSPGSSVTVADSQSGGWVAFYASQTPMPSLAPVDYYFAPVMNPNLNATNLPSSNVQPSPLPLDESFQITNQTQPLIIGSVGQPMIMGGWAKSEIENGTMPTGKYAYLGQYFTTNAPLLDENGDITTNPAGVLSPYGEFFPLQAGIAQLTTMPDIDTGMQGTNYVRIISLNVDANHDGIMDLSYTGPDFASVSKPFRFWANDNQDSGDFGGNYGIPGLFYPQADGWNFTDQAGTQSYDADGAPIYHAHGRRDLVDFFPVYLNIGSLFQSNAVSGGINPVDTNYIFALSHVDSALRFAYTDLTPTNYMNYLLDTNESGELAYTALTTLTNGMVPLSPAFLAGIATNNQGIILVEAAFPTDQPLVLTIYHGTNQIAQTSLPLSISGVEEMIRSKTIMLHPANGVVPDRLADADVPNEPDTIDKNFVFMHGYNVNPDEARGVAADMYKRMYWSGSHARFWAVTWEGADSKIGSLFTPNYHTNVVNAFNTAPLLADFIASLTNSGPVVAAAHSLGNMLTLSAISDWHAPISQYFMMDAAVPIEAIDPASTNESFMTFSTWSGYSNRLFAANWYQLFPTNDARSTLFWNNRLGNLGSVDVYNFYSSGEEVLRLTAGDPPLSTINLLATQVINGFSLLGLWPKVPFGTYSWYWQEKGKGTCNEDSLIGSSHGGWKFNPYWEDSSGDELSPSIMNDTATSTLQTFPMFDFNSTANSALSAVDTELLGILPGENPSTYAAAYRNRILSDAIPAMSLVAGANPIPKFSPPISPSQKNIDMMSLKNGWSLGRTGNEAGQWHHSDFVQMAYTFTHQLFDTFVTTGNLK